jgi:N utilization substance protein A
MSQKDVLLVVEALANEKGVNKDVVFEAVEYALATATRKNYDHDLNVTVSIDRKSGEYRAARYWEVVDEECETFDPDLHMLPGTARLHKASAEIGDWIEEPIEAVEFGRIGAQTAKQVILQKLREAERAKVVEEYKNRIGEILVGQVKRIDRGNLFIDLGDGIEAMVPRSQQIPKEVWRNGERVRAALIEVEPQVRGPQLILSRASGLMLKELMRIEVPEVGDDVIEIMASARDPGNRAKIAVKTSDRRLDPVGACIGMRGSRIGAVTNELAGEKIDVILWDSNPVQYVMNAMAPATVKSVVLDEETHSMDIAVDAEQLSQAIGKAGQNVRLASELTGWTLNVMSVDDLSQKSEAEKQTCVELFMTELAIDQDLADVLADEGFTTLEEIAYVPTSEMLDIEGFDEELVDELKNRAKDRLLTQLIATEEQIEEEFEPEFLALSGMNDDLAKVFLANGIRTRDDLGDLDVESLVEMTGLNETQAGELIMQARQHWFE